MKRVLILLVFFCQLVIADEFLLEINNNNLTLLALKNSPPALIEEYILFLAKTKHSKEYYKNVKNKNILNELFSKIRSKLQSELSQLPDNAEYLLPYDSKYLSYDLDQEKLSVQSIAKISQMHINRGYNRDGLPEYFNLLFANIDLLHRIKIDRKVFEGFLKRREGNKRVYIEITLLLPKFQNGKNFQAVLSEIKVYDSSKKKYLLGEITEQANIEELTQQLFLEEGITNKLIGIHAFDFFGYRLQDQLLETKSLTKYCKKVMKRGIHQVVVCKKLITKNTSLVVTYLGGIVAQIDWVATGKLSPKEINKVQHTIKNKLKKPDIFKQHFVKWSRYKVDFEFYADAIYGNKSIESTYIFPDVKEYTPSTKQHTLIVTMMSQATKKLLENLNET